MHWGGGRTKIRRCDVMGVQDGIGLYYMGMDNGVYCSWKLGRTVPSWDSNTLYFYCTNMVNGKVMRILFLSILQYLGSYLEV